MDPAIWWVEHGLTNLGHNMFLWKCSTGWSISGTENIIDIGTLEEAKACIKWLEEKVSHGILCVQAPGQTSRPIFMGSTTTTAFDDDKPIRLDLIVDSSGDATDLLHDWGIWWSSEPL